MQGCISVIIPVYNVERYLKECLDSIIGQTYSNLEVILIDDESSDHSGEICDFYAQRDPRLKVIHKKNGGAASARNEGLKLASGDYLSFVDGDDFLELDAYENLLSVMKRTKADIVQGAYRKVFVNRSVECRRPERETVFSVQDYLCRYITDWTCGLACDKLFKRYVLNGIFYETGHVIDDEFFTYRGVMNAKKVTYSPIVVYDYRQRRSSVMNNPTLGERMLFDRMDYSEKRRENVGREFPELKQTFDYSYLDSLLLWSKAPALTINVADEIKKLIKNYFKENKPCKMSMGFALQLLKLCLTGSEKLLSQKMEPATNDDAQEYFE